MATGIDDEVTLRANREGFLKFQLRPRRLIDVETLDLRMELFGQTYASPIVLAPTGSNRAFHEDGELAVARAARKGDHLQMLSTVATASIEEAIEARGRPVWFQLYPTNKWEVAEGLARRAEKAGAETIVVTADVLARQNWETLVRLLRTDTRNCGSCHGLGLASFVKRKPNFDGLDISGITSTGATNLTWDFIKRLRDTVKTRLVLKGLMTAEDAVLAVDNGLDAIVVSNHGGRAEDSGRSTIDALPEIIEAVDGRIPVLVDSGFRRGTDIIKALALGARAVCIGRPHLWGARCLRPAGRRTRARPAASGDARRHDAGRRAIPETARAGDGEAFLTDRAPQRSGRLSPPCGVPSRTGTRCASRSRRSSSRSGWPWRRRCARRTLRGASACAW
jgi:isopentenyl diphosphate isomerase/L-lactate dehydrogenase-like FMN-dependent dehydrogenase